MGTLWWHRLYVCPRRPRENSQLNHRHHHQRPRQNHPQYTNDLRGRAIGDSGSDDRRYIVKESTSLDAVVEGQVGPISHFNFEKKRRNSLRKKRDPNVGMSGGIRRYPVSSFCFPRTCSPQWAREHPRPTVVTTRPGRYDPDLWANGTVFPFVPPLLWPASPPHLLPKPLRVVNVSEEPENRNSPRTRTDVSDGWSGVPSPPSPSLPISPHLSPFAGPQRASRLIRRHPPAPSFHPAVCPSKRRKSFSTEPRSGLVTILTPIPEAEPSSSTNFPQRTLCQVATGQSESIRIVDEEGEEGEIRGGYGTNAGDVTPCRLRKEPGRDDEVDENGLPAWSRCLSSIAPRPPQSAPVSPCLQLHQQPHHLAPNCRESRQPSPAPSFLGSPELAVAMPLIRLPRPALRALKNGPKGDGASGEASEPGHDGAPRTESSRFCPDTLDEGDSQPSSGLPLPPRPAPSVSPYVNPDRSHRFRVPTKSEMRPSLRLDLSAFPPSPSQPASVSSESTPFSHSQSFLLSPSPSRLYIFWHNGIRPKAL